MVKNIRNRKVLALQKSSYKKKIKFLDGVLPTFLDTRMGIKYIKYKENVDKRESIGNTGFDNGLRYKGIGNCREFM